MRPPRQCAPHALNIDLQLLLKSNIMESIANLGNTLITTAGYLASFALGAYIHAHGRAGLPFTLKAFRKLKRMTPERESEIEQGVSQR